MRINAVCFTAAGAELINRLIKGMPGIDIHGYYKFQNVSIDGLERLQCSAKDLAVQSFKDNIPLVVVGAAGIAVRMISDCVSDKLTDIPVVIIDEKGCYVIPILSGHVGGANALAKKLAAFLDAEAVITTATDLNESFSVDVFAMENNLNIMNRNGIKEVSAKILRGEPIVISVKDYPPAGPVDVLVAENCSVRASLWLSPRKYVLGIGCRRGKTLEEIENAVETAMNKLGICYQDIYAFGSVDLKADEKCLLDFSAKHRIPFVTFESSVLMKAQGNFSTSDFVLEKTGSDNVCERSAVLLTAGKGKLVLNKQAENGVTVAAAIRYEV